MNQILTTVITISGISGALALLLSIANKTIANYGEMTMTINDDKEYIIDGGDTLLSTLTDQEIFIPSACGGKGSCGFCKVTVKEGGGQFLATELGYVSEKEREAGVRLSCQCKVKEDIKIEIPDELFYVKQYNYDVISIEDVTPKIKHVTLRLPNGIDLEYSAGQYVQILTPIYKGNEEEVYRAYSLASPPNQKNVIELFIGYIPEGICTTYVHKHLNVRDKLTVVGPFGDFKYRDGDKEMVMVAIGTGMAPIFSILRHMVNNNIQRKATFFFGARTKDDLYMMDELKAIEKQLPNFRLITCLSRPTESCNWDGEQGRVTDLIKKFLTDGENKEAYLCGSPKMIDSVIPLLKEKGLLEENILYDKFE